MSGAYVPDVNVIVALIFNLIFLSELIGPTISFSHALPELQGRKIVTQP